MWINLARLAHGARRSTRARSRPRSARCELDRTSTVACRIAAELALQMARPADALRALQALSDDAPRDHDYYNALGNALFQTRQPRQAVDAYFKALALKVDSAIVHYRLGLCFMDLAMDLEAAQCFRTAISLDDGATRALALSLVRADQPPGLRSGSRTPADTRALLEAVDRDDPETARLLLPFALISIESTPQQQRRLGERRVAGLTSQHRAAARARPAPAGPHPRRLPVVGLLSPRHRGADDRAAGAPRHEPLRDLPVFAQPRRRLRDRPPRARRLRALRRRARASATAPSPSASATTASTS